CPHRLIRRSLRHGDHHVHGVALILPALAIAEISRPVMEEILDLGFAIKNLSTTGRQLELSVPADVVQMASDMLITLAEAGDLHHHLRAPFRNSGRFAFQLSSIVGFASNPASIQGTLKRILSLDGTHS